MNDTKHQEAVKKAVKGRFRGHTELKCRTTPRYPDTAEREFKRITNAYMKCLNEELKSRLPELLRQYKRDLQSEKRYDSAWDIDQAIRKIFLEITTALEQRFGNFGLDERVAGIAKMTKNNSLREWKRAVHQTLGIDLLNDYYGSAFYEQQLGSWVGDNVLKIKTIPQATLEEMRKIILEGYRDGKSITALQREIQNEYNVSKHKAQMLARDQVATLNAQIARTQQEDAGVTKYRWSTSHDSRVRDCHAELDGKVFSWDDPPEMWYETQKTGRVFTGRRCHPGEDYCCRCVAIPVFDFQTIDVPMAGGGQDG